MKNPISIKTFRSLIFLTGVWLAAVLPAQAGLDTWTGASSTSANWSDSNNWQNANSQPVVPAPYDALDFTGSTQLISTNNFAGGMPFDGLIFDNNAGAFTLYGNNLLLSGNTNATNAAILSTGSQTQTLDLGLNVDWGYYTIGGNLNINSNITPNLGAVVDFSSGTINMGSSLSNDPTGLIAGLGGAGLYGTSGAGAGATLLNNLVGGNAVGAFSGFATISGGTVQEYQWPASQQLGFQPISPALGYPIGADDNTTLTTGFTVPSTTLTTGFTRPAIALATSTGFTNETVGLEASTGFTNESTTLATPFTVSTVVTQLTVASATGIYQGDVVTGTGIPAGVTVSSVSGTTINVSQFTATANSAGNYDFAQEVSAITVASPTGIAMSDVVTGTGIPAGVTVSAINGSTISVTPFACTASSSGNYTFAAAVNSLTVASGTGITIGAVVTGTGVPAGVTVTGLSGTGNTNIAVSPFAATATSAGSYTFSQVVTQVVVASSANIVMGAIVAGTGVPAGVTVTGVNGNTISVSTFTCTAASTGNYTFSPLVTSVVVTSATGIQQTAPFTGTGVSNGVTVTGINGNTITLSGFYPTASSSGNYAFATIASESPQNVLLTGSFATAATTNYPFAAGTSTVFGSNNTYVNTITMQQANGGTKTILGLGNANGGTLVLGSTNYGSGLWVGGIYTPNTTSSQGITMGDGNACYMTCGPMSGNPVPGEIIVAINGNADQTSNEGEMNAVIKDNLSGGKVSVVYAGGGTLYVNVTNSYSGGTYMVKGRVQCNQLTALGSGPVYIMGGDAEISLQNAGAGNIANNFFISPSSTVNAPGEGALRCDGTGAGTLTGTLTLNGNPITPLTGPTFSADPPNFGDRVSLGTSSINATFAGQITGQGTLELFALTTTADFVLSNTSLATPNNWKGGLIVSATNSDGSYTKIAANNQLATNNVFLYVLNSSATARLDLNGFSDTINGLSSGSNYANLQLANFGATPSTLTMGVGNQSAYFGGTVGPTGATSTLSIVKDGSGTQTFGGATTYNGATTVNGGVLWISNSTLSGNTAITVNTGGLLIMTNYLGNYTMNNQSLNLNGGNIEVGAIAAGTGNTALTINGSTLSTPSISGTFSTVGLTNATVNLAGISGSGAVFSTTNFSTSGANTFNITNLPPITKYPSTNLLVQAVNISGSSSIAVNLPATTPPYSYNVVTTSTNVQLVVTGGPIPVRPLTWIGSVTDANNNLNGLPVADWDVQTTDNWLYQGNATYFNQDDEVAFADTATATNVYLTSAVSPLTPDTLTISNNAKAFTFTGPGGLSGLLTLVKQGTNSLAVANSGPNTFSNGIVAAGGTLLLQDQSDAIIGTLTVSNGAQVILDDSSSVPMQGGVAISPNSTVQVGTNDGNGVLPTGSVLFNGGGTLVFATGGNQVAVPNAINGAGTLVQSNNQGNQLQLTTAQTGFTGTAVVAAGILQLTSLGALNNSVPILVSNGATLDFDGNAGAYNVTVQGAGVNGNGALINNGGVPAGDETVNTLTLSGNTTLGGPGTAGGAGNGRWDLRPAGGPATGGLVCAGGNPYNIVKVGPNFIAFANCSIDPNVANIDIQGGTLQLNGTMTGIGNPAATIYVESSTILDLYAMTNHLNKVIQINDGGELYNDNSANVVVGPVILGTNSDGGPGNAIIETAGASLTLSNGISGSGNVTFDTTEPLMMAGNNTYTGTTTIAGTATTYLLGNGSINNSVIEISQGATLDVSQLTTAFTQTNPAGSVQIDGTLNVGATMINNFNSLIIGNGTLSFAPITLGSATINVTNLTINGGTLNLVSLPVALTLNQAYPVIHYQNLTTPTSQLPGLNVPSGAAASLTIDTVNQNIDITVTQSPYTIWNGGSLTDNNWTDAANWNNVTLQGGGSLVFAGDNRLDNTNNEAAGTSYSEIVFAPGAGPFQLNGNPIELGGPILNQAANPETVSLELDSGSAVVLNGGTSNGASLVIGGVVNQSSGANALYLNGFGAISNNVINSGGASDAFYLTNNSANWTLLDSTNPVASTVNTQNWGFLIYSGTFNFGSSNSAPAFVADGAQGAIGPTTDDNVLGYTGSSIATFNMVNGSLTLAARFDTAGSVSGAVGTFNQTGGTFTLNGQLQGANIGGGTSTLNLSGGTFSVVGNTTFVASRGVGTLTVSSNAVVNLATLDVARGAQTGTANTGIVNLNGGTLTVSQISTATANAGSPTTGYTGTLNMNGGTLVASASSTTFITDSSGGGPIPLSVYVQAGGAMINDGGHTITSTEALQHPAALGSTSDGGLTKLGAGTLTLANATNSYTGSTVVSAGTLACTGLANLTNSVSINIASGATLSIATLAMPSGQSLLGSGNITGALNAGAGSFVTPGSSNATGTLTASGAISLSGNTMLKLTNAANDELASSGAIIYGGALAVTNMGATLVAGDTFTLFQGTSYSGSFSSMTLPALSQGLEWQNNLSTSGAISVVASVPTIPVFTSFIHSGGNLILSGTNGPDTGTFYLLTSTNLAVPLTNWTVLSTNSFNNSGNFSVTNPIGTNSSSYFILSVP